MLLQYNSRSREMRRSRVSGSGGWTEDVTTMDTSVGSLLWTRCAALHCFCFSFFKKTNYLVRILWTPKQKKDFDFKFSPFSHLVVHNSESAAGLCELVTGVESWLGPGSERTGAGASVWRELTEPVVTAGVSQSRISDSWSQETEFNTV